MQTELFEQGLRGTKVSIGDVDIRPPRRSGGTKDSVSRYSGLKESLDRDLYNANWSEVVTSLVGKSVSSFNFIDLFSGAGGFSVGFKNAGFNKILSIDIDEDASNTVKHNFPESIHFNKPINDLTREEIYAAIGDRKIHVICGGPPCQGFSVAGLRNPHDPRNQLFKEYIRIVNYIHPAFVVLENVPGILTMQGGKVCSEILRQFSEIGYPDMTVRILEAATYGVAQLRTRAVFVGNRLGLKNPYPKEIFGKRDYRSIESAIADLKDLPEDPDFNHVGTRHSKEYEERIAKVPPGGSLYDTFRDAFKRQYRGIPSMTIKENHGGVHIHYELNRVLTAREMARLQTFPDEFFFTGSHKRAYWQIGNAVPCLLAEHIALALKSDLISMLAQ